MPSASSTDIVAYDGPALPLPRHISPRESAIVTDILQEFGQYQAQRSTYAAQCEEVAQLILPTSRNTFFFGNYNFPGAKKTQQQVDATGARALHRFCAIADSLVTPRNMHWHGLQGDDYVMKDRATRLWFENATALLFRLRYAATANFAAQNYNNWQSLGAFGNSTMFIDKFDNRWHGGSRGLRYKSVPFGETFFGENHQGKVDRMIRWFRMTPYQAVQKWGIERLPEPLHGPLKQNSQYGNIFLHCVRPRSEDYDPEAIDVRSLPFQSFYVSIDGRCLMQPEGGYSTFPYAVSRYDQAPGEVYGRGPAQIVLPSLKTLNAQKGVFLKQGHRAADPVLLMADDGVVGMNLRPGAQNVGGVTADGKILVHTLPTGEIQIVKEMMAEERGIIDDVFLVTIMQTLVENPNMTATQVIQIVNERAMLVTPTLGRQHSEFVGGMVPRELDLAAEMGMVDAPPPRLREALGRDGLSAIQVSDTSPLAEAAKSGRAAGFLRSLETSKEIVNITQDPSHLDWANLDVAMPAIARIQLTPEEWILPDNEIAAKRQARAKQIAQQQQIEALPKQAAMLNAQAKIAKAQPGVGQPLAPA